MENLKPCPFCGGEAKYIEFKEPFATMFVTCADCGIETKRNYLNRTDAITAWNTRKPMERVVERIENEILEELSDSGDDWFAAEQINKAIAIVKGEM